MFFVFFLSDEGPMLVMLDYTIRIGSTPTFLYFDLYLYSAYAAHYVHDFKSLRRLPFSTVFIRDHAAPINHACSGSDVKDSRLKNRIACRIIKAEKLIPLVVNSLI